ncbi:MAG: hypothetical protein HY363_01750, partial [Candidatus Aenigmarchaeota archaeon]|nr:hypothetical protein [Candidatus Aenigmarchaeota archaeon]
ERAVVLGVNDDGRFSIDAYDDFISSWRALWVVVGARKNQDLSKEVSVDAKKADYSLDDIAVEIVERKEECSKYYSSSIAKAFEEASGGGKNIVASMPALLAARVKAPNDHLLWHNWYTALTEEDVGIDAEGLFGQKGKPVVVVVHGGGLLSTPDRLRKACNDGLINCAARLSDLEMSELLKGRVCGTSFPVYPFDYFKTMSCLPVINYGIVLDFETAKNCKSGYRQLDELYNDALFIARAGGMKPARQYLDRAAQVYGKRHGNWHNFDNVNTSQSQGRPVHLSSVNVGLSGYYISDIGRFVGVCAGGAWRAEK